MKKLTQTFSQWLLTIFLLAGVQFTAASQTGTHLNFDGVNDYVTVPSINFANQSFTIECWAKRNNFGSYQYIASEGNFAPSQFLGILFRLDNSISISFYNNDLNSNTQITDFNWHHYAFTFNSTTKLQAIYIDGVLDATRIATTSTSAFGPFSIGQGAFGGEAFSGDLEELRIWNIERTGAAINSTKNNELLGNESGLVAYYKFNQGIAGGNNMAITTLTNSTVNALSGTITNFTLSGATSNFLSGSPVLPPPATHLHFDGVNDLVHNGTNFNTTFSSLNTVTVEAWVKPETNTGLGVIAGNYSYPTNNAFMQFLLRRDGTNYIFWMRNSTNTNFVNVVATNAVVVNTWQHVVGVRNGDALMIYVNGVLVNTATGMGTQNFPANTGNEFTIGGNGVSPTPEFFKGGIDEIRVWTTAVAATDIVGRKNCELQGNEPSLYAYYKFNQGINAATNTAVTTLNNSTAIVGLNGILTNMALTGATSNWLAGTPVDALPPSPTASSQTLCTGATIANLIPSPSTFTKWYSVATGGTTLPNNTTLASGTYYVAAANTNGCESIRTPVSVNIVSTPPAAPTVTTPVTYCPNVSAAPLSAIGTDLRWYTTATGGIGSTVAPIPNTSILGTTSFWVASSYGGSCLSSRTKIDVVIDGSLPTIADNSTLFLQILDVNGVTSFSNGCIDLITKVTPNGANPVSGSTWAWVWIEGTQDPQFVNRHYEITPDNNASVATGRITLYFKQQEFTDFNAVNTIKLPTNSSDASGKANLIIEKYGGVSYDQSGLPYSYTGSMIVINPSDADIVWNSTQSRWEVSFDVTGFSGFFVKTISAPLPLHLLTFSGSKQSNNEVLLQWQTTNEINSNLFEIEVSSNATSFVKLGSVTAKNTNGINSYQLSDNSSWTNDVRYYRLKIIDNDDKFKYSAVIRLSNKQQNGISIYPNPVKDIFTLQITDNNLLHTIAVLIDVSGKLIKSIIINNLFQTVDISTIAKGIYLLKFEDGSVNKIIKE